MSLTVQHSGVRTENAAREDALRKELVNTLGAIKMKERKGPLLINTNVMDTWRLLMHSMSSCFTLHRSVPLQSNP